MELPVVQMVQQIVEIPVEVFGNVGGFLISVQDTVHTIVLDTVPITVQDIVDWVVMVTALDMGMVLDMVLDMVQQEDFRLLVLLLQ